jgi:hypothetical protein
MICSDHRDANPNAYMFFILNTFLYFSSHTFLRDPYLTGSILYSLRGVRGVCGQTTESNGAAGSLL